MAEKKVVPELKDEEAKVKVSICKKCKGWVRAAVEHKMTKKHKAEFSKECFDYNLEIREIPLLEFRKNDLIYCRC